MPTTMWQLLIWAYRRQMVQFEVDRAFQRPRAGSLAEDAIAQLERRGKASERGCINGAGTTAHADAHVVHEHVRRLDPSARQLVIAAASRGTPPEWNPTLPELRVVPLRKGGTGMIRMMRDGRSHRPVACLINYEGIPKHEADSIRRMARASYAEWGRLLRTLRGGMWLETRLTRWRVTAIGADITPWLRGN